MKKEKTNEKKKGRKAGKVILCIFLVIAVLFGVATCVNVVGVKSNSSFIKNTVNSAQYENQLVPEIDKDGNYSFTTDRNFRIMQLTDIHIGSGFMSIKKDNLAINSVASMITAEKPDLVVVTGDIAYPIPFQSGTLNNKRGAILFADLMEKLGVYWCLTFGNHDTEAYSFFTREQIGEIYSNKDKYPHCLFQPGDDKVDGVGNYVINVRNSQGKITQSLFMIDSHSYTDNDYFGVMWKYDAVHKNQIEWYKNQLALFTEENAGETPKSLMFMHIPIIEFRDAYYEYRDNNFKDTENVKFLGGKMGEHKLVVYSSSKNNGLFDAVLSEGSTQGMFFGHDHLNNMSLEYKGVYLSYSYSVDYLAYAGIMNYGAQRGCSIITVSPDGTFKCEKENYYQDKYVSPKTKETVDMGDYNDDAG